MHKQNRRQVILSIFFFILFGLGISLQLKAAIGQSILNALAVTISHGVQMKVGSVLNIINSLFFISYLILRQKRLEKRDGIQIAATVLNGYLINFFLYSILSAWTPDTYLYRILLYFSGLILASVSLGAVLAIGLVKFPLESLCLTISEKYSKNFSKFRMTFDGIFLASALILSFICKLPLEIREGTLISILLLSPLLGICYNYFKKQIPTEE